MNAKCVGLVILALVAGGCAAMLDDPYQPDRALEEAQRRYTQLMRWGEIELASQYVDPAFREKFRSYGPVFEQIRITDYEIGKLVIEEDDESAWVNVIYRAYGVTTLVEKTIRERQEWFRDAPSGAWRVQPELEGLLDEFSAR